MTQQHSPEPWSDHYDLGDIIDSGGHYINKACKDPLDTQRIIACINACQGISNEELEAGVIANKSIDWSKMPPPECLRNIAGFLDRVDEFIMKDDDEVQRDLRQWADYLEELAPF